MAYNLEENVKDYFEFELAEGTYRMEYPTGEFIDELKKVDEKEQAKKLIALIQPTAEGQIGIEAALNKKNIKVIQNFNTMLTSELGISTPQA